MLDASSSAISIASRRGPEDAGAADAVSVPTRL